jgi:hypothetical protein
VEKLLAELENPALGAVMAYEADGDPYLFLPKLAKHQRLEPEKVKSRLPAPPEPYAPGPDDPAPRPAPPEPDVSHTTPRADLSEPRADESARGADESEPRADSPALLYVAGSREHVAGGRGPRAHAIPNAPQPGFTEVPEDFQPTDAMRRWAHSTHPGLDLDFETTQFIRHFRGEGRRKKSWVEPWQKWIADSHRRAQRTGRPGSPGAAQSTGAERAQQAIEAGRRVQALMDGGT